MASRAIWEGSISFGLVQIPVGLYAAETRDDLDFDLLDRRDMAPVGYRRYNRNTDEPIEWADIVKGYEYAPGEYVTVEKEDFKRANVRATQTVDIVQFTDAASIDPMYFERPYYLVPGKRGAKAYALLREVLRRTGKVGVARVVIRTRESVAALMVRGPALVLELLRFDHELRKPDDFELPSTSARELGLAPAELKMAERLVSDMEAPFKPAQFKDTYRDDLLKFIQRKIDAGDTAAVEATPEPAPEPTNVVDIMALLRRSLDGERDDTRAPARKTTAGKTVRAAPRRKAAAKTAAKKTPARSATARKPAARKPASKTGARAQTARKAS